MKNSMVSILAMYMTKENGKKCSIDKLENAEE